MGKPKAKSNVQRQRDWQKARRREGRVPVTCWPHKDDADRLRTYNGRLLKERGLE